LEAVGDTARELSGIYLEILSVNAGIALCTAIMPVGSFSPFALIALVGWRLAAIL